VKRGGANNQDSLPLIKIKEGGITVRMRSVEHKCLAEKEGEKKIRSKQCWK